MTHQQNPDRAEANRTAEDAIRHYLKSVKPDLDRGRTDAIGSRLEAAAQLIEEDRLLLDHLREDTVKALRMEAKRRLRPPRKGPKTPLRDVQIVCALLIGMKHGLRRTRSRESKVQDDCRQPSASSIVADALSMSESAVEKIWESHDFKAMPIDRRNDRSST